MEAISKKVGVVVMMLMMVRVVMGQSVYLDDLVDYSLSDIQPLENSAPVKKLPPSHQTSTPTSHVPPPLPKSKGKSCLRKCQKNCSDDKVTFRKACFDACPSKCKIHSPSESIKNCVISCLEAIPNIYAPALVVEESMRGRLDSCYKTCSARIN